MKRDMMFSLWARGVMKATIGGAGLAVLLVCTGSLSTVSAQGGANRPVLIPNHYIIVLQDAVSDPVAAALELQRADNLTVETVYDTALNGFEALVPADRLSALSADTRVKYIEQDEVVQIDPFEVTEIDALNRLEDTIPDVPQPPQVVPQGVVRIGGTQSPTAKISGTDHRVDIDIAIIDSGIQVNHPDLNVVGGRDFTRRGTSFNDENGHGTHVAGTVAALDNGIGVVGVAPGARLWAVRVMNQFGTGSTSSIISGINWVAQRRNIRVANMSVGGNYSRAINEAVERAVAGGLVIVAAAGNESQNVAEFSPASSDSAISVSALQTGALPGDELFARFSNFGVGVTLTAPGVGVRSTYLRGRYATMDGTSMAAPHVTGAAALYLAGHPGASPAQVRQALLDNAEKAPLGGWIGDPDGEAEPLVRVDSF
jgi:subtilisin family serine protease